MGKIIIHFIYFSIFFFILGTESTSSQKKVAEAEARTPVLKSLSVKEYKLKFGVQEEFGKVAEEYFFDSSGNLVESIFFFPNNTIREQRLFQFDSSNNILAEILYRVYIDSTDSTRLFQKDFESLLEETENIPSQRLILPIFTTPEDTVAKVWFTPLGNSLQKTTYIYDEGLLVEKHTTRSTYLPEDSVTFSYNDTTGIIIQDEDFLLNELALQRLDVQSYFEYDDNMRRSEERIVSDKQQLKMLSYKYNGNGQRIEKIIHDSSGGIISKIESRYSAKKITEEVVYDTDGKVVNKTLFKYNAKGKLMQKTTLDTLRYVFADLKQSYDTQGRLTEEVRSANNGRIDGKNVYRYNANDDVSEQHWYLRTSPNPSRMRRYSYEFYPVKPSEKSEN
ncbi:MAG: hypothetical protein KGZ58_12035 [Ignavibacteriales bacterium]|nr:hypothetical protein [Ignavibacteriales bacterium]